RGALAVAVETDLADIAQAVVAVGDAQVAGVVGGFEAPGAVVGNTQGGGDGCGMGGHLLLDGCQLTKAVVGIVGGVATPGEGAEPAFAMGAMVVTVAQVVVGAGEIHVKETVEGVVGVGEDLALGVRCPGAVAGIVVLVTCRAGIGAGQAHPIAEVVVLLVGFSLV